MKFFKPEDFDGPFGMLNTNQAAKQANEKLTKSINKIDIDPNGGPVAYIPAVAGLIYLQMVENCEHNKDNVVEFFIGDDKQYKCKCGAFVIPTAFEAL